VPETPLDISRTWVEFTDPADVEQRYRCRILEAELAVEPGCRSGAIDILHDGRSDANAGECLGMAGLAAQVERGSDREVGGVLRRIKLDGKARIDDTPGIAIVEKLRSVECVRKVRRSESPGGLDDIGVCAESGAREQCRFQSCRRSAAAMRGLGHGADVREHRPAS